MANRLGRRSFLQGLVVTVAVSQLPACSSDDGTGESGSASFPQGVASGDPRPDSVILWTRALPSGGGSMKVKYEVSLDEAFTQVIAQGDVTVSADADYTLRVKPVGLTPFTTYYYRFKARDAVSTVGKTKTAPSDDQDVPVRFAFASCQDFVGRYYHSWRAFLENEDPVDFVLFLGDYIYETNGDPDFQQSTSDRKVDIKDGIQLEPDHPEVKGAKTLDDYRGLYQRYRGDEWLQQVHANFPFICIWDDHEFANDCWQDHATDFNEAQGDEKSPERRHAASRAWFEYQPADVTFDDGASPPDDLKIYRKMRYGKHVELFLTDQRSYRADHTIPEGAGPSDTPPGAPDYLTYFTAGKLQPNQELGSRNFVRKTNTDTATGNPTGFDEIEKLVKPTMLGAAQKQWLVDGMKASTATWKIWGNETQLIQMIFDLSGFTSVPAIFKGIYYFTADQWDGYRSERAEVLGQLAGVQNLVVVTGDIHAFYAGELHVDFDNPGTTPIGVEYVCAGISSSPVQEITETQVLKLDADGSYGLKELVPQFDSLIAAACPHTKYGRSFAHGLAIMDVDGDKEVRVTFLDLQDVKSKDWDGKFDRTTFRTTSGSNLIEKT
jgi:alkaline phosphatase D